MTLGALFDLNGRRALVTGASRGLGRAMAEALASAGADVICATSRAGGAASTIAAINGLGREAWEVVADLGDRDAVDVLTIEVDRLGGPVDILVNNAGMVRRAAAIEYSMEDWDDVMRTNLDATFIQADTSAAK